MIQYLDCVWLKRDRLQNIVPRCSRIENSEQKVKVHQLRTIQDGFRKNPQSSPAHACRMRCNGIGRPSYGLRNL
jgi:hypothetical protein